MLDYSSSFGSELAKGMTRIANERAKYGQSLGLSVDAEDVAQELAMAVIAERLKDLPVGKALSILKGKATSYIYSQRNQVGGYFTSPELLAKQLDKWSTGELDWTVSDALYGSVFAKAGSPAGSYFSAVQERYQLGIEPVGEAARKKLHRAVNRLAEIISGVMVGPALSIEQMDERYGDAWHQSYELELEDSTFNSFTASYVCSQGHVQTVELAVEAPKRIGVPHVYGYRLCRCGADMELAN